MIERSAWWLSLHIATGKNARLTWQQSLAVPAFVACKLGLEPLEDAPTGEITVARLRPFEVLIERQVRAMGTEAFQRNHGEG